jgi:hypothetical protein
MSRSIHRRKPRRRVPKSTGKQCRLTWRIQDLTPRQIAATVALLEWAAAEYPTTIEEPGLLHYAEIDEIWGSVVIVINLRPGYKSLRKAFRETLGPCRSLYGIGLKEVIGRKAKRPVVWSTDNSGVSLFLSAEARNALSRSFLDLSVPTITDVSFLPGGSNPHPRAARCSSPALGNHGDGPLPRRDRGPGTSSPCATCTLAMSGPSGPDMARENLLPPARDDTSYPWQPLSRSSAPSLKT